MKKNRAKEKEQEQLTPVRRVLRIAANTVGILLIIVLLPVMIINVTLIIRGLVRPDEVPTFLGIAPLIVESGSMQPDIMVNDLILTRRVDAASLEARQRTEINEDGEEVTIQYGDIIAFQIYGSEHVITHRIIEVLEEDGRLEFVTAGDYTGTPDADTVMPHQIVGRYFARFAGVGSVALFLQQPIGMVVFVAIPLVLFLVYDLLRRYIYNKKHKQQDDSEKDELERLRAMAAALEAGEVPEVPAAASAEPKSAPESSPARTNYPPVEGEDLDDFEDEV